MLRRVHVTVNGRLASVAARRAIPVFVLLAAARARAQGQQAQLVTHVAQDTVPVERALVRAGGARMLTDAHGNAELRVSAGVDTVIVTKIGFRPESVTVTLRAGEDTSLTIQLAAQAAAVAPIFVTSTRAERRLEQEPLRIEVLGGDDVSEKSEMRPAEARSLLSEMSGVRTQTRSPLGATNIRIQGLPGRYTAVLSDGLPLYGQQASSFTLVDVVPLDLRQAEVIKGAATALYGPQALAGVVDLISRRPPDTSQVLANQSAPSGTDLMSFVSRSLSSSWSGTLLAGAHRQLAGDVDRDGWTDIPGVRRLEARPRLFWKDDAGRSLMLTAGGFAEQRSAGGVLPGTAPVPGAPFADSLITAHADAGLVGQWRIAGGPSIASRLAWSTESRRHPFGHVVDRDTRRTLFGELAATYNRDHNVVVIGGALSHDSYANPDLPRFDVTYSTPGLFAQETFTPVAALSGTVNGRCDWSNVYGTICSPRLSLLARAGQASSWSARVSAGSGWFAPRPLTDETETFDLSHVFVPRSLIAERGRTLSLDVTNTQGPLQLNGTLFANRVQDPLGIQRIPGDSSGGVNVVNAPGPITTHGGELFAVFSAEPVVATAYYALTRSRDVSAENGRVRELPLTPRESAGLDFALEDDESGAYGALEVFYTGRQALEDDPSAAISRPYTTVGVLLSKQFGRATPFLNGENLTDVRLTNYEPLRRSRVGEGGRWTVDPWAPLEGRRFNVGVRWRL